MRSADLGNLGSCHTKDMDQNCGVRSPNPFSYWSVIIEQFAAGIERSITVGWAILQPAKEMHLYAVMPKIHYTRFLVVSPDFSFMLRACYGLVSNTTEKSPTCYGLATRKLV